MKRPISIAPVTGSTAEFRIYRIMIFQLLVLIVSVFAGRSAAAQDFIKLKSGKEIKVSIISEAADAIKYRDFDDPSGPVYSVKKDLVESVKYKKGSQNHAIESRVKEIPEEIKAEPLKPVIKSEEMLLKSRAIYIDGKVQSPRTVKSLMEDYPEIQGYYNKGRKMCSISNSLLFGSIITSFITTSLENGKKTREDKLKVGIPGLSVSVGFIIAAAVLAIDGKKNIRKSVTMYNATLKKQVTYNFDFGFQQNGIGMSVRF